MLVEEIETLRGQMQDMTAREEAMLKGLAASLHDAEQRLLAHVREIATRHTERRTQLVDELRALATGLGSFPAATVDDRGTLSAHETLHPQVTYEGVVAMPTSSGGGHWREATRMINDEDDVGIAQLLRANAR